MNEMIPVLLGVGSGFILGSVTARHRLWLWLSLCLMLGLGATVATGEWQVSWTFLAIDVPLVALVSGAAFMAIRGMRRRRWVVAVDALGDQSTLQ